MKFIKLVLAAALCQLLTACAPPQSDESTKTKKMIQQAEQGDAHAQLLLGWAYRDGEGVPQDYAQAVIWLRKAAEQGDAFAQDALSDAYREGNGVPQDDAQSVYWLRKSAEQGNTFAQGALSHRYQEGKGVPQDEGQAVYWLRKIAEQGGASAQYALSDRYQKGKGVPQDFVLAYAWLNLAVTSQQGEVVSARDRVEKTPDGIQNLKEREVRSRMLESAESALEGASGARDSAAEKLSPSQLAEAQRLSSNWQKASPSSGKSSDAMRKKIQGIASAIFWFTAIIYGITLAAVSYVGVYLTYVAVPTLIVSGCIAWCTRESLT